MKRFSAAALLCCLLGASLISCGGAAESPAKDTQIPTPGSDAVTSEEDTLTEREKVSDDLPEADYGGRDYRIMLRTNFEYEFDAAEPNGETINDSIYARNLAVSERFNVNFKTEATEALWNSGVFNKKVADFVLAGDDSFDIIAGYMCDITPTISQGLYINWYDMPHVDLKKPWWSENMIDEFTINNRLYMLTGDLALSFWRHMYSVCFNKSIAAANDIDDLYSVVLDGKWTFPYMQELCKNISADVNGDGKMDDKDMYGFTSDYSTAIDSFKEAFDLHITVKDTDGIPRFTVASDRTVEVLEGLAAFYKADYGYFNENGEISTIMFRENRALFSPRIFKGIESMRDLETDFGILPYPKWDEAQASYGSVVNDNASVFLVPLTAGDLDFVGTITEAMAAENYKHVVPDYYDIVLKTKTSRDEASEAMIDLIRDSIRIDFGYIHSTALEGAGHLFVNQVRNKSANIASAYQKIEKAANKKLETIVDFYFKED
ncbi:MAG: hypothetical protein MJ175_02025 [Clostridia bacterium]|nr:hypothetical protein [Clostridia bacterium]